MIPLPFTHAKTYAVMGLGRSGLASARALAASGARVWAWDDNPAGREAAAAQGIALVDLNACDWSQVEALLLSPGIPHEHPAPHPIAAAARAAGVPLSSDVELLARAMTSARFLGVTGTNGKSTTTALIAHILLHHGLRTEVGGNLGRPVLDFAPLGDDGVYVLELSSYQLERVQSLACDVSVFLNISPDHIDRHGDLAGYIAAKRQIFANQGPEAFAVIGVDDAESAAVAEETAARRDGPRVIRISVTRALPDGIFVRDGILFEAAEGRVHQRLDLSRLRSLPGAHNWQNAAAAFAAARALGMPLAQIVEGIASFPGLPHRQQDLGSRGGVRFVNDSKATNADAAARALGCYDAIYWIAGGRAKSGGIQSLTPLFDRVREAFLIGEAAADFARILDTKGVRHSLSGDLGTATRAAFKAAREGGARNAVVLLSPACASFDQFRDFEARGEAFLRIVESLGEDGHDAPPRRRAGGSA